MMSSSCYHHETDIQFLTFCLGIVTRCPLELKMIRSKEEEKWHGRISYQNHEEDFDDPAEVEKKIREGRNAIKGCQGEGAGEGLCKFLDL